MKTSLFDFQLPEERIALRPAVPRDSARMLVVGETLRNATVRDLPDELRAGDLLVLNESRVFPAKLTGIRRARAQGGGGDVTLDVNLISSTGGAEWTAFARPAKRLKLGDTIYFEDIVAEVTAKSGGEITLCFDRSGAELSAAFERIGVPPLPPYIARKRELLPRDREDYQTVYADPDKSGSVAAPTAGLHFTPELLAALEAKGVETTRITLHVGAGTFLPVSADDTDDHHMHSERFMMESAACDALNAAREQGRRVIAVGTTSLRALESAELEAGRFMPQMRDTDIFITPGYAFQAVDGLMTNFHLPKSTLFMLVSAFAGLERMQAAYAHAVRERYRFYSYGDSSLLWRGEARQ